MKIFVVNETPGEAGTEKLSSGYSAPAQEKRCGATPATVKKLIKLGAQVVIESGAGEQIAYTDEDYRAAGAVISTLRPREIGKADIVLYVNGPTENDVTNMRSGTIVIGHLDPFFQSERVESLRSQGVTAISVEMLPRITRAQKMDALSSQNNLAGYAMVLQGIQEMHRILPMMMTPAGTIKPAKVFVIGAGVAGLQAIATARRLGASVTAFDTRPVVAEQVRSLGAKFLDIDLGDSGQTQHGYANALTQEQIVKQKQGQRQVLSESDLIITTAQLFGRKPPLLITEEDLSVMQAGSVVVDMAAENGGNVAGSVAGKISVVNGVRIVGTGNWPNLVAKDATDLYANNLLSFLDEFWVHDAGSFVLNLKDEILDACVITHGGTLRKEILNTRCKEIQGAN